jgi:HSP20 family protein
MWDAADMDKFFDENMGWPQKMPNFTPAVDVYQDKDNVIVEAPLAGVDPEKVNISVENDVLHIEGNSEHKSEVEEKNYYRQEVRYGRFYRSVALPTHVKADKAKATFENGILKVIIPKAGEAKPKSIKVVIKKNKK